MQQYVQNQSITRQKPKNVAMFSGLSKERSEIDLRLSMKVGPEATLEATTPQKTNPPKPSSSFNRSQPFKKEVKLTRAQRPASKRQIDATVTGYLETQ